MLLLAPIAPALAASETLQRAPAKSARATLPTQLSAEEREGYRAIFTAIRGQKWADAAARLDAMKAGPLHTVARAELYLAKGSPKVELDPLVTLLNQAPDMPQSAQLARLATTRGATELPAIPTAQRLIWLGSRPLRQRASTIKDDAAAAALGQKILPLIKNDDPAACEALIDTAAATLSSAALTEWQQRVAWSYYLTGNDRAARALAAKAQAGTGEWAVHADWVAGLAAWRDKDFQAARTAFESVAARGEDSEMRAAGLYWASRADIALGEPQKVQGRLRNAARMDETFYGLLASETLGIKRRDQSGPDLVTADWGRLSRKTNIATAVALSEIGEFKLADEALRHQARIGGRDDHAALVTLAERLNLPETQLWLAHNGPAGANPGPRARYPAPDWTPDGGWRVDRSLLFAHALQESNFRRDAVSPAGAYGLMQIMPAAAQDISRRKGTNWSRESLTSPSTNMEYGQAHLEALRDFSGTEGLLPKVIAAYNAGPAPVRDWNARNIDRGDPLLYIESIPYWETRGYVTIVLRNYWMYERNAGERAASMTALAQGLWPRFPGLPGATAVRMDTGTRAPSAD
ncbi:lytic transglycosylase domain-containing protein [Sphingomonas colocasiae]|uniref:Lytic transglycosylase domain-containing protein n=1 Tax=Sphingomonas colocasiae TaxID=1848973 RepID=A0ABS7PIQ6_9SPHN|nr:lytic transglycosylase domain-containing protein [Sphingomonas colocasiae]